MSVGPQGRIERLDHAERWLADGIRTPAPAGGVVLADVDMTRARSLVEKLREAGVRGSYTHLFVRATALALARRPDLHFVVGGARRLHPSTVDIGLSVAGTTPVAPVMVVENAGARPLPDVAAEIARRAAEVRARDAADLARLRRWGWLVPFAWLRRFILRRLYAGFRLRRRGLGTFQVSCLPDVDGVIALIAPTTGVLTAGRVADRVVAVDGAPAVRPMVTLVVSFDHAVWDGVRAAALLGEVRKILETGELESECPSS